MKFLRTADAFRPRRREGPYRFTQKQPPAFVSALRRVAAVDAAKITFREIFGAVRFSTCSTVSALFEHGAMSDLSPLCVSNGHAPGSWGDHTTERSDYCVQLAI